jgi:catechol 2,3-dioxygenase-like lactoylglutathione lyase family enzyme
MKLMPIVYVTDMGRAADFYTALGFQSDVQDRAGMWAQLTMGDAALGLHYCSPLPSGNGRVALALVSDDPLEGVVARLKMAGVALEQEIAEEAFGRSIQLRDPDGLLIQINEHDTSLYT